MTGLVEIWILKYLMTSSHYKYFEEKKQELSSAAEQLNRSKWISSSFNGGPESRRGKKLSRVNDRISLPSRIEINLTALVKRDSTPKEIAQKRVELVKAINKDLKNSDF